MKIGNRQKQKKNLDGIYERKIGTRLAFVKSNVNILQKRL